MRYLSSVVAVVLFLSSSHSLAEPVALRMALRPGHSWTFEQSQDSRSDNKATAANGMTQPFTTINASRRSGKVEVLAVEGGAPTSLRITYDDNLESSTEMVGQGKQSMPFPYAGKTITLSRDANGRVTDDFQGQADPAARNELHGLMEQGAAIFPKGPVEVGEKWQADRQLLSRMLQLPNPDDQSGMALELLSVKDVNNRPTAEVKVSLAVESGQGGLSSKLVSQGVTLVDLATGHAVQTDLKGTINIDGQQQDGQGGAYRVEGKGTMTMANKAPFINAGDAVAAMPAPRPAANEPAPTVDGNPLADNPLAAAAPADPFAGTYSDGKLKLELAGTDGDYKGTIVLGSKTYPVVAKGVGGKLDGTFDAGGKKFPFVATVAESAMKFETGGATYSLKKTASAKPAEPVNPLAPGADAPPAPPAVPLQRPGPPAPVSAVALRQYNFPDGTGSIGLAPGWTTNAQTCQSGFSIVGPSEQRLTIGTSASVNTPNSTAVRMQLEMEANARQWGMAPPPRVPMLVAPYCGPAEALQVLIPQVNAIVRTTGGAVVELGRVDVVKEMKADLANGRAALLRYDVREHKDGSRRDHRALANVQTTPLSNDVWMFYAIEARSPVETFDTDLPVMLQMLNSWKIDQATMQQVTRNNIDASNRTFAAGQAAHKDRMAAFDSYNKAWSDRQRSQDRGHADFIETIRGTRTIEDTRTGERRDADLGHSKDVVDTLNERDPDRFREVPLRDQ